MTSPLHTPNDQLRPDEKDALRRRLLHHIEDQPLRVRPAQILHHVAQRGISLVLLAAFPSLLLVYVAGKALPTHGWLYEVKRGVEEVAVQLQPTSADRLSFRTEQITRRIQEVADLSVSESGAGLDMQRLSRDLAAHVADIQIDLESTAAPEREAVRSRLDAKQKILETILADDQADGEAQKAVEKLRVTASSAAEANELTALDLLDTDAAQANDARDEAQLQRAEQLQAEIRVSFKSFVSSAGGKEHEQVVSDLQGVVENLDTRLANLTHQEHLGKTARLNLKELLIDLEAFSELLQSHPLLARRFIPETNPSAYLGSVIADIEIEPEPQRVPAPLETEVPTAEEVDSQSE